MRIVHTLENALTIAQLQADIDYVQPLIEEIVNSPKPHTTDQVDAYRQYRMTQINAKADIKSLQATTAIILININALKF